MTEKEKSHKGVLYFPWGEELSLERANVRKILYKFNNLPPDAKEEMDNIIRNLLSKTGKRFSFERPFMCEYGYNLEIGENFYANYNLIILDNAKVKIGDNVLIAPNVGIYTAGHPLQVKERNEGYEYAYPVTIGDNVWIGAGVQIMPGVTIGDNTVIAGGSVVVKDIPPNVLAAGNPCKPKRSI